MKKPMFEEFYVCPHCRKPLYSRADMESGIINSETRDNYCVRCGKKIASAVEKALAVATSKH